MNVRMSVVLYTEDAEKAEKREEIVMKRMAVLCLLLLCARVAWAEDFSAYARCCPSLYMFLGAGDTYPLHSPYFDFDESVLKKGLEAFVRLFFS